MTCPMCAYREQQMERMQAEVLAARLALANGDATKAARADLAEVNRRLAEANQTIGRLRGEAHRKRAS